MIKNIGLGILGLWLLTDNIQKLFKIQFPYDKTILASIALSAGILLLINTVQTRMGELWVFLLSIWLLLSSGIFLFKWSFPNHGITVSILGAVTGIFLLVRK